MEIGRLMSYVWLVQAFYAMLYLRHRDSEIVSMIKTGNISYELVRPQKLYFMWFSKIYGERLSRAALRFLPVILVAVILPGAYKMHAIIPIGRLLLFILAMILSNFLMVSLVFG